MSEGIKEGYLAVTGGLVRYRVVGAGRRNKLEDMGKDLEREGTEAAACPCPHLV